MGSAATATALLGIESPRVLHIATHGIFQPDRGSEPATRGLALLPDAPSATSELAELRLQLVQAALVLAAEQPQAAVLPGPLDTAAATRLAEGPGPQNILTALQMVGMHLQGTRMVVLSTCNSGIGDIARGQGVYGLRRALLIAGAETLVTSLWRVDDRVTAELMRQFYTQVRAGRTRGEALRHAALAIRHQHPHPYYWSPFILVGDSSPLKELAARSRR